MNWLFISIGFIGTVALGISSVYALITCLRAKSFQKINLFQQALILFGNVCFFVFAFGISIINIDSSIFWNSSPTWVANSLLMILNTVLVIGKVIDSRKTENKKENKCL